jgi:hypothetical protein
MKGVPATGDTVKIASESITSPTTVTITRFNYENPRLRSSVA